VPGYVRARLDRTLTAGRLFEQLSIIQAHYSVGHMEIPIVMSDYDHTLAAITQVREQFRVA
jgi:hypothetical protein